MAPAEAVYDPNAMKNFKAADGCYLVRGFEARWVSGATAGVENVRLCGGATGSYTITLSRDSSAPGLERDLQFALQLHPVRAQQQQARAARDTADNNEILLYKALATPTTPQRATVNCTSTQYGNTVNTNCR